MVTNLDLINWQQLLFSSIWIVGFAIILAALSYHSWEAQQQEIRFRTQLGSRPFQRLLWIGLILVTIGFAGNSTLLWERAVWGVLTLLNAVQLVSNERSGQ